MMKALGHMQLCKVTVARGPLKGQSELCWMTALRANECARSGAYTIEEVANCAELGESLAYRRDKSREVISKNEILDTVIDLNRNRL